MCFRVNLGSASRTGRKTTKYKRGAEAVWPSLLENSLLEGLEQYSPPPTSSSSKHPRQLQRFPQRNKLISQYIFDMTGIKRTPKQVGSRLQQLRETSTDPYILFLIKDKVFGPHRGHLSPSSSSRATRSLRSSPSSSADLSDYEYDYSTPSGTPIDVNASIKQQQEDVIRLWGDMQAQQQAPISLAWEQTSQVFPETVPDYQYQLEGPSTSTLGAPFGQQDIPNFEPQQMTYATSMIDGSVEYGAFFTASGCDVSIGAYNAQPFSYENVSPLADVDSSLYGFSTDSFTLLQGLPTDTYPTVHLPQSRL